MQAPSRLTLEICIDPANGDGCCPVRARVLETDQRARSTMQLALAAGELAHAQDWLASAAWAPAEAQVVRDFGARLFAALFSGAVRSLYDQVANQPGRALAFWLVIDDDRMAQVPWELLFDDRDQSFLALDRAVRTRHQRQRAACGAPARCGLTARADGGCLSHRLPGPGGQCGI